MLVAVAAIINGIPSIRKLVVPGRDAIDVAARWIAKMREMDQDATRDYHMTSTDKEVFATIVLGLAIRNGLTVLGIMILVGMLSTGGL